MGKEIRKGIGIGMVMVMGQQKKILCQKPAGELGLFRLISKLNRWIKFFFKKNEPFFS